MPDRLGIGVDRERNSTISGPANKFVIEVRAVGKGVDFQGRMGAQSQSSAPADLWDEFGVLPSGPA